MGRPKVALIEKSVAIAKALEIIDRDGIEALSIRRLGAELGVNGASLYHHFKDKDEILDGVRRLVLARLQVPESRDIPWQDFIINAAVAFREALLRHPNTAPLMVTDGRRAVGIRIRDFAAEVVLKSGVPAKWVFSIIDSTETLAFGAAMMNPNQLDLHDRFGRPGEDLASLRLAIANDTLSADARFRADLEALLEGWTARIEREAAKDARRWRPSA